MQLKQQLGTLNPAAVAQADLEPLFRGPAIHRFPGSMATRVRELAATVAEEYGGDAARIWTDAGDGKDLRKRIGGAPGFGEMKIESLGAVLSKRFGVTVRRLVPAPPTLGDRLRRRRWSTTRPGRRAQSRVMPRSPHADRRRPAGRRHREPLAAFIGEAEKRSSSDLRHRPPVRPARSSQCVPAAHERGVAVRLAYNADYRLKAPLVPPPPTTVPAFIGRSRSRRRRSPASPTSCTTSTSCATAPRCGRARRTGRSTRGRARRTSSHRRVGGARRALPRGLRAALDDAAGLQQRQVDPTPVDVGSKRGSAPVAARSSAPHRARDRLGRAARPHRLSGHQLRADPHVPRTGGHRREDRHCGGCGRDANRRSSPTVARERDRERHPVVEEPAAADGADARAVLREGDDAVRAGLGTRLHARKGDGRGRHGLPRELQPLALGGDERGERARNRRRGHAEQCAAFIDSVRGRYPAVSLPSLAALVAASAIRPTPLPNAPKCQIFPADNAWNTPVDTLPVAESSATMIKAIGLDSPLHPDFGAGQVRRRADRDPVRRRLERDADHA